MDKKFLTASTSKSLASTTGEVTLLVDDPLSSPLLTLLLILAILLSFFLKLAAFLTSRKEELSFLAEVLLSSPDVLLDDTAVPSSTIVLEVCKSIETCLCKGLTPVKMKVNHMSLRHLHNGLILLKSYRVCSVSLVLCLDCAFFVYSYPNWFHAHMALKHRMY